jgi:hypothetical protein
MCFRMRTILWKLMVQCDALKRLVEVLDTSSAENDSLRKYVPTSMVLLAVALNVASPRCRIQRTRKHKDKYPDQLEEMASGSSTVPSATEVKTKWGTTSQHCEWLGYILCYGSLSRARTLSFGYTGL